MLKHYFRIALRNLLKNRTSSFINIAGLSVGMSIVILISLYIWDEVAFDHYHQNHETLAQIMTNQRYNGETSTMPIVAVPSADALRTGYVIFQLNTFKNNRRALPDTDTHCSETVFCTTSFHFV